MSLPSSDQLSPSLLQQSETIATCGPTGGPEVPEGGTLRRDTGANLLVRPTHHSKHLSCDHTDLFGVCCNSHSRIRGQAEVSRDVTPARRRGCKLFADAPVDPLAQQISVADVASVFRNHVVVDPP